jgi:hypothetical protein
MVKPNFKPAICTRCKHMGESEIAHYRANFVACKAESIVPMVLRMNGFFHAGEFDRLIPRRELTGFVDGSAYDKCQTFEERKVGNPHALSPSDLPERDPRLVDMLKNFIPEKNDG